MATRSAKPKRRRPQPGAPASRSGRKPAAARAAAAEHVEANPLPKVDAEIVAAELVPDGGPRRIIMLRMLSGLFEAEEHLRIEAMAGSTTAARALNETRRIITRLCGFDDRPAAPKTERPVDEPGSETDVPMWVPAVSAQQVPLEPDDADLNAAIASSLGGEDDG